MKFTKAAIKTNKEAPADADSANARFLTQGGFIHQEMAGVYTLLSLGKRVLRKIEQIVREEMNGIDSVEIGMPALTPLENWKKTGRDNVDIAFKPNEKTVLGWSHEEIVTPLAKSYINSWKDLPLSLYQIQTKFRNEARAKSGILRGREFIMKDMYSFHATQEDLDEYYQRVLEAYLRVYKRCGLQAYAIEASGGVFTKKISHEFAALTIAGEDIVIFEEGPDGELINPQNAEIAVGKAPKINWKPQGELEEKVVERAKSVSKTAEQYGVHEAEILKTVVLSVYTGCLDSKSQNNNSQKQKTSQRNDTQCLVGISIRGDLEVNMEKVMSYFQTEDIRPATSEELKESQLAEGFISPIKNTNIAFYADESVREMTHFCTGANKPNTDYFNANIERDCDFVDIADFVLVTEGFTSVKTGNALKAQKCVEVGNIFDLGTKYSEAFNLKFTNTEGKAETPIMGCYGLGVSRLLGTIIEAHHDDNGIIWPKSIAPYHVVIIPLGKGGSAELEKSMNEAEQLEISLQEKGIEVLIDDRDESPGKKFADADLIGIPLRIVISPRTLEKNAVEWKERDQDDAQEVVLDTVTTKIVQWLKN